MSNTINLDDLYKNVADKKEIKSLAWYSQINGKEPIALIDEKLPEYY